MNKTLIILTFLSSTLTWAQAPRALKAFDPSMLNEMPYESGDAKVNDLQMKIHKFDTPKSNLLVTLQSQLKNQYTVTQQPHKWGRTILIAPVQSYQCPLCPPLQNHDPHELMNMTYIISEFSVGASPMVFGSSAKGMLDLKPSKYEGPFLDIMKPDLAPQAVTEYRFANTFLSNLSAETRLSLATTRRLFMDEMRAKGYKKLPQPQKQDGSSAAEEFSGVWQRQNSVLHISAQKISQSKTQLQLTEIITR